MQSHVEVSTSLTNVGSLVVRAFVTNVIESVLTSCHVFIGNVL